MSEIREYLSQFDAAAPLAMAEMLRNPSPEQEQAAPDLPRRRALPPNAGSGPAPLLPTQIADDRQGGADPGFHGDRPVAN